MKFLVDECTDAEIVHFLREENYDDLYVMESMRGIADDVILSKAYEEQRILLIEDKDFGELVFRLLKPAICVILLRFKSGEELHKIKRLGQLLTKKEAELVNKFIVVDKEKIRTRPLIQS